MRTLAQQTASRANGARSRGPKTGNDQLRSSMGARSLTLLTRATVLKGESRQGFQKLVHQHMLFFAPRNPVEQFAVEEICSATWRLHRLRAIERKATDLEFATQTSPDDLRCLVLASGELAGKNRHLHLLLQRHEPRLQNVIRRPFARLQALRQFSEKKGILPQGPQNAPTPYSTGLRAQITVPRKPNKNPRKTRQNPPGGRASARRQSCRRLRKPLSPVVSRLQVPTPPPSPPPPNSHPRNYQTNPLWPPPNPPPPRNRRLQRLVCSW